MTAVTKAAVDAILARNSLAGKVAPTNSSPLVDVSAPIPSVAHVTSSSFLNGQPKLPNNASTGAEEPKTVPKCPICDQTPSHVRTKCPLIKAGIRAMRRRIAELRQDTSEGTNEEREKVIEELQRTIDKRSKSRTPKSTADKLALATDNSSTIQPPKTSKAVEPAEVLSQEIKSTPLPHFPESLSSCDALSYTVQDLEALIRGPNVTLADVPLSDSSEDEQVLEEEPEEVQEQPFRSQGHVRYSSSSEEEEEEEEEASPFVPSVIPLPIKSASELSSPQSDPIEAFEKASSSPPSPIVSIEDDHLLQSTPKTKIAVRTKSRQNNSLAQKSTDLAVKSQGDVSRTRVNGVNGLNRGSLETIESAPSNAEQSLASWAVLEGNSQCEISGMIDELRSSPDAPHFPPSAPKSASSVVNGVHEEPDPLFLQSESQQSFPYSQYPSFLQEPPGSEDEEDEVEASVVKSRASSSKFRSLTEIASQPTLFTPTLRLTQNINTKEEVMNMYGRASKVSEGEESEDSESESEADAKVSSHIPMSRRAGNLHLKRR